MKKRPCGAGHGIPLWEPGQMTINPMEKNRTNMKSIISMFVVGLLAQQIAVAQGTTTYLSNLGQASAGSRAVGSDSWLAAAFMAGANAGGYVLNSVQLALTDASGNPTGFRVMIYNNGAEPSGVSPGTNLCTLNGSLDPVPAGVYT